MARQKNYAPAVGVATVSYAMLGRIADAQMMLARRRELGFVMTISQVRKRLAHLRQEDAELYIEARCITDMPE